MVDIMYTLIGVFCSFILVMILFQNHYYPIHGRKQVYFGRCVFVTLLFCIVDALWGAVASGKILDKSWLKLASTFFYLFATLTAYELFVFVFHYSGTEYRIRFVKLIKSIFLLPFIGVVLLLAVNWKTGIIFYTAQDGSYCRGIDKYVIALYILHHIYFFFTIGIAVFSVLKSRKENKILSASIALFALFPFLTSFMQLRHPEQPFYSIGYTLACFAVFLFEVVATRERHEKEILKSHQTEILSSCAKVLQTSDNPDRNINTLLAFFADYYNATHTYISELSKDKKFISLTYEWTSDKGKSVEKSFQKIDAKSADFWFDSFRKKGECVITNPEKELYDRPDVLEPLLKFGIKNCVTVPLISGGNVIGIIGADNPTVSKDDATTARIIAFYISSELLRKKYNEKVEKTNSEVIDALSAEYESVYHIELETGKLTPCRYNSAMKRLFEKDYEEHLSYSEAYIRYVDLVVLPKDREEMREFGMPENIRLLLKNSKKVVKRYQCTINGVPEFFEAKWVKIESQNSEPKTVVLGLANIDESIRREMQEENEKKLYQLKLDTAIEKVEEANRESQTDKLTGLYNKAGGMELMNKYVSEKFDDVSYALLFIDLDKFKDINDTFGHLEGDNLLQGVGKAIKQKCRLDDIAVRFGGDEFMILLKDVADKEVAKLRAEGISREIVKFSYGKEYKMTCSIGIVVTGSNNLQEVIDKADKALYIVKNRSRDGIEIIDEINF